jgi:tyrosyl-tRNA synthetase
LFTELDKKEVEAVVAKFSDDRGGRIAQKRLAHEVTKLVHGQAQTEKIERVSEVLFGGADFLGLELSEVEVLKEELPVVAAQDSLPATIAQAGLASSNSEAVRFIEAGAISINGQKADARTVFRTGDNLLKRGKNSFAIVELG